MNRKHLFIALFMTGLALLAYYGDDLSQENSETIFLSQDGIKKYNAVKERVPEKKAIIFKLVKDKINYSDIHFIKKLLAPLKEKYEDQYDFVTIHDVYKNEKMIKEKLLEKGDSKQLLKLIGSDYIAFMVIENFPEEKFNTLIFNLKKYLKEEAGNYQLKIAGIPYTNFLLDEYSETIKRKIFPMVFIFAFILIIVMTRSFLMGLLLFIPCLFSAVLSLAVIKYSLSTMNMITSIVPLMCFTINLANIFHLFFSINELGSFGKALKYKIKPISLMLITTLVGFGSLYFSNIKAIEDFGALTAGLIMITTFLSILWLWSVTPFLLKIKKLKSPLSSHAHLFFESMNIKILAIFCLVSVAIGLYSLSRVEVITDATRYFPEEAGIKKDMQDITQSVVGIPLIDIILDISPDNFSVYQKIEEIEKRMKANVISTRSSGGLISLNEMVKGINFQYSGKRALPTNVYSYNALRSRLKKGFLLSYPMGKFYKVSIMGNALNVDEYEVLLNEVREILETSEMKYEISGLYYNLMISQKEMMVTLVKSFLIALLLVSFIGMIYLKRISVFFIFMLVNITPVILSMGILYLLGLSLNIATIMTYSIAIGMIVDSSFHIIHNLKARKEGTFSHYFKTTVVPVISSSLLLMICFSFFAFNSFLPIREFGINLCILLFLGLIFDLFVLPTLYLGTSDIKGGFQNEDL